MPLSRSQGWRPVPRNDQEKYEARSCCCSQMLYWTKSTDGRHARCSVWHKGPFWSGHVSLPVGLSLSRGCEYCYSLFLVPGGRMDGSYKYPGRLFLSTFLVAHCSVLCLVPNWALLGCLCWGQAGVGDMLSLLCFPQYSCSWGGGVYGPGCSQQLPWYV